MRFFLIYTVSFWMNYYISSVVEEVDAIWLCVVVVVVNNADKVVDISIRKHTRTFSCHHGYIACAHFCFHTVCACVCVRRAVINSFVRFDSYVSMYTSALPGWADVPPCRSTISSMNGSIIIIYLPRRYYIRRLCIHYECLFKFTTVIIM